MYIRCDCYALTADDILAGEFKTGASNLKLIGYVIDVVPRFRAAASGTGIRPASNNVADYGVKKAVENLPHLRKRISAIIDNYHNVQQDINAASENPRKIARVRWRTG